MEMERRFCEQHGLHVEQRAEGGALLVGYAAVFESLSVELWGFREKIAPGAFTASLGDDVRALWNHDTGIVLGRAKNGTLRLAEDKTGLRVEIEPPASAANYVESIQRGDVDQMSFGFRTLEDTWDEDGEGQLVRTLLKVKLYEVSPVSFPAYSATSVGVRASTGSANGVELDAVFGWVPTIPPEFRRELRKTDHWRPMQQRWAERKRRLQLIG